MKLPISWLKEYVEFEDTVQGLADKLTFSGVEVEGIETMGADIPNVVAAEILSVEKHPDADRLSVCTVFDGEEELQVVCGAPNAAAGMKAVLARIGAVLPSGLKIKKAKVRGVVSFGMLCAEDELGLSSSHDGIIKLDDGAVAGTPLAEIYGPPETVLDLEITPNRPDCLSIIGMAREVAALYGSVLKRPEVKLEESGDPIDTLTSVTVEDSTVCPRYSARIVSGVTVAPSPEWMQKKLTLAGVRPINNIVDITNFVMLETGQPLHAFDRSLLAEGRIVVRRANAGEKMTTLDEQERELSEEMLMIADAEHSVALAGVMGGAGSEVSETTTDILLESACFEPIGVRTSSRSLGLMTESSYRFERGVDIEGVEYASRRAAALMQELSGGSIAKGMIDVYPIRPAPVELKCRYEKVTSVIGIPISAEDIQKAFTSQELAVPSSDDDHCVVSIPSFRPDLVREVDLIEEVARLHGLDKIPTLAPRAQIVTGAEDFRTRNVIALRNKLSSLGLREITNYSLVSGEMLDGVCPGDEARRIKIPNPISADQSVLRTSLVPQMIHTIAGNRAHQIREAALYESGRIYFKGRAGKAQRRRADLHCTYRTRRSRDDREAICGQR